MQKGREWVGRVVKGRATNVARNGRLSSNNSKKKVMEMKMGRMMTLEQVCVMEMRWWLMSKLRRNVSELLRALIC